MNKNIFLEHGREFYALSSEGWPEGTVEEEMRGLYQRFDKELRGWDLSLANTVRTRTWARDKKTRDLAADERSRILAGKGRAASSSYISLEEHFDSNARVVLELIAMRPANPNSERKPLEYDPVKAYLRYLIYDSFVFLSGSVAPGPNLDRQLTDVLAEIDGSLADAGTSWDKVTSAAYFLHRSQKIEALKDLLEKKRRLGVPKTGIGFVDDFAPDGIFIEVEVTAKINK
ncbi:MAG: hypothetical protein HYV04_12140 [Deltaproteobacteria bacterium]|nr:hypothetical protein [Deltaproteobacteria bacterium]